MPEGDEELYQDPAMKPVNKKPEDGEFFRFSHTLCEALFEVDELTKTQVKIILYIARMTWGWNRPRFEICQKTASEKLGIHKSLMSRSFNALVKSDVLMTQKGEVGINKYREQWNLELLVQLNNSPKQKEALRNRQQLTILPTVDDFTNSELTILPTPIGPKTADNADSDDPYRHTIDTKRLNSNVTNLGQEPSAEEIFASLETKGGKIFDLPKSKIEQWKNSFPGLDVEAEVRRAIQWHIDNPAKRKTPGGMLRFFFNWMSNKRAPTPAPADRKKQAAMDFFDPSKWTTTA